MSENKIVHISQFYPCTKIGISVELAYLVELGKYLHDKGYTLSVDGIMYEDTDPQNSTLEFVNIVCKAYGSLGSKILPYVIKEPNAHYHMCLKTSLDFIEYQANTCAAAFLMPQDVVREEFKKRSNNLGSKYTLPCDYMVESIICDMADVFSVSKQAMRYRLNALNMVTFDATPFQFKISI